MSRPRLLVIGPVPPPVHGVAVYVRMLLEDPGLRRRWEVHHLDTSDRRSLENLGRVDPTNVALGIAHVAGLARLLLRLRPDVVWIPVSQNAPAYLRDALFMAAARAAGARVVTHLHGGYFGRFVEGAPTPVRAVVRASSRAVDAAWVLGEGLAGVYGGLVPGERVRVVPNGVAAPGEAGAAPAAEGPFHILYLGQLSRPKGVVDLVEAFGRLELSEPPRLVLAGPFLSWEDESAIRAAVEASPAADRVELAGVVEGRAKAACFARTHVLALPTWYPYEGQPLVVLEAMAAGLPVVATRRGAIPDMVTHGVTGLLVPERDPAALTAALARLAAAPEARTRMGEAGRSRWRERFTARAAMGRVAEELERLLPAGARREGRAALIDPSPRGSFPEAGNA